MSCPLCWFELSVKLDSLGLSCEKAKANNAIKIANTILSRILPTIFFSHAHLRACDFSKLYFRSAGLKETLYKIFHSGGITCCSIFKRVARRWLTELIILPSLKIPSIISGFRCWDEYREVK